MNPQRILAKSDSDYDIKTHGFDVSSLVTSKIDSPEVKRVLRAIGFSDYEINCLEICVDEMSKFHDCGKGTYKWQISIRNDEIPPSHAAKSAFYLWVHLNRKYPDIPWYIRSAVVLSVLHHHTEHLNSSMDFFKDFTDTKFNIDLEESIIQNMIDNMSNFDYYPYYDIDQADIYHFKKSITSMKKVLDKNNRNYKKLGTALTFAFSYLQQFDGQVSGNHAGEETSQLQELDISDIQEHESKRPTQNTMENYKDEDFLTLVEDCGGGKTGASVIWAKDKIRKGKSDRVIYAMPTQVTCGNMMKELCGKNGGKIHYPENKTSIYHSNSSSFIENNDFDSNDIMHEERARKHLLNGCSVITIDHLLNSLVNSYRKSNRTKANILTSAVVIDEIHSYNEETTSNILKAIEILREFNVPVLVMTATLPPQIKYNSLKDSKIIEGEGKTKEGIKKKPCYLNVCKEELTGIEVLKKYKNNPESNRVMVTVNTVNKAKEISNYLMNRNYDVICYTGRMTSKDRIRKENYIQEYFNEPCEDPDKTKFLICTQVCEISLDIDSDLLLTQIAPVDDINQRIGRLHRNGQKPKSKDCSCTKCKRKPDNYKYNTYIFSDIQNRDKILPYTDEKGSSTWELLKNTQEQLEKHNVFSFDTSKDIVSESYKGINLKIWRSEFDEDFMDDLIYGDRRTKEDDNKPNLNTRDIKGENTNVLAGIYLTPDGELKEVEELWKEYHDDKLEEKGSRCTGECGIHKEENNICREIFYEFKSDYSIRLPIYKSENISNRKFKTDGQVIMDANENPVLCKQTIYDYRIGLKK
jgi:CRISPR-associated helicase Cas3